MVDLVSADAPSIVVGNKVALPAMAGPVVGSRVVLGRLGSLRFGMPETIVGGGDDDGRTTVDGGGGVFR